MKRYKVFDPITGEHTDAATLDEVRYELKFKAQRLLDAQELSVVEVDDDGQGNEIWTSMDTSGLVKVAQVVDPPRPRPPVLEAAGNG